MPDFPLTESGISTGAKPQVRIENFNIDGKIIGPFTVLKDELIVLGWYAEALVSCLKSLCELNGTECEIGRFN